MSPSSRALAIPELLEMILQHSPAGDMLSRQRVNETFQSVIQSSRPLQCELFFSAELMLEDDQTESVQWIPLINYCQPNPEVWKEHSVHRVTLDSFYENDYPTASWNKMFVTSPAVKNLVLFRKGIICCTFRSESGITIGQLLGSHQKPDIKHVGTEKDYVLTACFVAGYGVSSVGSDSPSLTLTNVIVRTLGGYSLKDERGSNEY